MFEASTVAVPPLPAQNTVSDVEIETISNCAVDWRELATKLGLPQSKVRDIEQYMYTSERERCRAVLRAALAVLKSEDNPRESLVKALLDMGWKSLAESLEGGYTNRYSAHSLL